MAQTFQEALFARANKIVGPKRTGYSPGGDPFSNFRTAETIDVEAWRGALVRLLDKVGRIKSLTAGYPGTHNAMLDEDDGLLGCAADLLNYTVIVTSLAIESLPEEIAQQLMTQVGFDS